MAQRRWCFAHSESTRRTNWPCIYWTNTVALFSLVAMRSRHVLHWQSRRPNWRRQSRSLSVDTIMRHPMLQVGMVDATSKTPSWIQLQSLDLTQHIKWLYIGGHDDFEQTVQEIFRTQLDDRFPDLSIKQPGWKITVIRQGNDPIMEVLLTWNHPQFDGAGAKVFHEDFLEMLNADNGACERTGLDGDILRLPQAAPLLPTPIESLKSLPVDLKYLAKVFWEETRPRFLNRDVSQAAWFPIRSAPYKPQFRAFFIDDASLRPPAATPSATTARGGRSTERSLASAPKSPRPPWSFPQSASLAGACVSAPTGRTALSMRRLGSVSWLIWKGGWPNLRASHDVSATKCSEKTSG